MKSFIENSLGVEIEINDLDLRDKLPLLYIALYDFKKVAMNKTTWIIAIPKEKINLSQIRKQHRQIERYLKTYCAVYFEGTSPYSKKTMISDGISFIIEGRELYLPFMGVLLDIKDERTLKPVQKLSFLTQKLLLTAIYEKWFEVNVTKAAEILEVTKMSVTRCFDEIEYMEIPALGQKGKSRVINIPEDRKTFWNDIKDYLNNPVITRIPLDENSKLPVKGGMSALADYSMIEDNKYPTYAVQKKDINKFEINDKNLTLKGEEPGSIVQKLGYLIPFNNGKDMDPLSVSLSLTEEELSDERVKKSVDKMLEEYVWSKD